MVCLSINQFVDRNWNKSTLDLFISHLCYCRGERGERKASSGKWTIVICECLWCMRKQIEAKFQKLQLLKMPFAAIDEIQLLFALTRTFELRLAL